MSENKSSDGSGVASLGRATPDSFTMYPIGVTIALPRVRKFTSCDSIQQKRLLKNIFKKVLAKVPSKKPRPFEQYFEYHKDGNVHTHIVLRHFGTRTTSVPGLIQDIYKHTVHVVNDYLKLKIKIDTYKAYHEKFLRVTSPLVTVQYYQDDVKLMEWETYIKKDIDNGLN